MDISDKLTIFLKIVQIGCIIWLLISIGNKGDKMKQRVGQQYVLNKDTLIITDWSVFGDKYYLSNGASVTRKYVDKQ